MALISLVLGQSGYISGVQEGHLSTATDIERHLKRRPCSFSPRRSRSEEKVG